MTDTLDGHVTADAPYGLHLMDGTTKAGSYAVAARRGSIFLGIRFAGLIDGSQFGVAGTTYVNARLRSARIPALAQHLDGTTQSANVVSFADQQLDLATAWPAFSFESVNAGRASLSVGAFVQGGLTRDIEAVIACLSKSDLFGKLASYVIAQAGTAYCIANPMALAAWLSGQAEPLLQQIMRAVTRRKLIERAQQEFAAAMQGQIEVIGPHPQTLNALCQKHALAHAKAKMAHYLVPKSGK